MKNRKLLIIAPIIFVICAVGILFIRESYSATESGSSTTQTTTPDDNDDKKYKYIRRNMLSHHFITSNSDPSGTILLKSGDPTKVTGVQKIVYCAHKGKWIAKTSQGKYYKRVPISKTKVSALKKAKSNLIGVMTNSYPYISLSQLKDRIKAGIGEEAYAEYKFDMLDAQESMTATQAAIWNAIAGKKSNTYRTTKSVGTIRYAYFHKPGNNVWGLNWDAKDYRAYDIHSGCYKGTGDNKDCEAKSTFLAPGDTQESVGHYNKNNSETLVKKRINRLISWYFTLTEASAGSTQDNIPDFSVKPGSEEWSNEGKTLKITIVPNNDNFIYDGSDYKEVFKDLNGKELVIASKQEEKSGDKITGYTYTFNNLETNGITGTITATVPSDALNVYVYQANLSYSSTQYLIGAEPGSIEIEDEIKVTNENKGKLYIYKKALTDVNGSNVPVKTEGKLDNVCTEKDPCQEGVTFAIYQSDKETVYAEVNTGTEPIEINLPLGTYYIQEVAAPSNYLVNDELFKVELTEKDQVISVRYNNIPTMICVQKISSVDKKPIEDGATFQLLTALGNGALVSTNDDKEVDEDESEDKLSEVENFTIYAQVNNGVHCTAPTQFPIGYYYIEETEAPKGFQKNNTIYRIRLGTLDDTGTGYDGETIGELSEEVEYEDGTIVKEIQLQTITTPEGVRQVAVIENKPSNYITKSDVATGDCVEGAHLVVKDETGKQVDEWTSSCEEGKDSHEVEIGPGKYTLTEETAPGGYATAESIEFTVNADGSVDTSLDMKDAPIQVCFEKISGNKKGIAGAEFEMLDKDGKVFKKFTTSTDATCFQYVPVGKYTIKETKAPDGYEALKEPLEITVKDTAQTQTFTINNEVKAAKTSMDASQLVVIVASIFMVCGLGLVLYYGYKKQA